MKNNTAIYCRLSVDDKDNNESNSIINQKNILIKYCKEHKFNIHKIYIDPKLFIIYITKTKYLLH